MNRLQKRLEALEAHQAAAPDSLTRYRDVHRKMSLIFTGEVSDLPDKEVIALYGDEAITAAIERVYSAN